MTSRIQPVKIDFMVVNSGRLRYRGKLKAAPEAGAAFNFPG